MPTCLYCRWRSDGLAVGIPRLHGPTVRICGRSLLVIVIVLAVFRIDRIVTGKFLLEPSTDGLKCPSGLVSYVLPELDDGSTISIRSLTNGFSGMVIGFL